MTDIMQSYADMIGTRICHDLISPIGAIGNGLELMSLNGSTVNGPEMTLISQSLNNAQARIRFYRIAFGLASPDQAVAPGDATGILGDVYGAGRLKVDWQVTRPLPRPEVKLAFLLIQCLETAMPQGGQITARHDGHRWAVAGEGPRFRNLGETWNLLTDPQPDQSVTPEAIQFALAAVQARDLGRKVVCDISDSRIILGV